MASGGALHCQQTPQQWSGRGCPPRHLGVLKAPHFQELHLEVLLAERRIVEGLAVLRAPPEQVGVEGQSLASPSTCKSKRDGWDLLAPPRCSGRPSHGGLSGLCSSLCFPSFGHSAELGWGCPELPSLLIGMSARRQSPWRALCRAAGTRQPAREVALAAQTELLNCLESWRTRKSSLHTRSQACPQPAPEC